MGRSSKGLEASVVPHREDRPGLLIFQIGEGMSAKKLVAFAP
jgi:hypothetical protein